MNESTARVRETRYIESNVVRERRYLPERPSYHDPRRYQQQTVAERLAERRRQHERAMDLRYVLFLSVATLICAIGCVGFLQLQASVTARLDHIARLQTKIENLQADNKAAEIRIEISKNLVEVKSQAQLMGLENPKNDQIRYYTLSSGDYMHQYDSMD